MTTPTGGMQRITPREVLTRFDGLLIDAYGVLVDSQGALPGAQAFVRALRAHKLPWLLVTNDASRLPETIAARMTGLGLPIDACEVISSASLLPDYFRSHDLFGAKTVVLGTQDSKRYVERAGGEVLDAGHADAHQARAVVVCDVPHGGGFAEVAGALDVCVQALVAGRTLHLVLCNPDVVYPAGNGRLGLTSGAVMLLLEAGLKSRLGAPANLRVARLGKPYGGIFAAACDRLGRRRVAMLGDQLATDVQGAHDFGIPSVLVGTGLTQGGADAQHTPCPHFFLPAVAAP